MSAIRGRLVVGAAIAALALAGCLRVSTTVSGAASVEDLAAENAYIAIYMQHMTQVASDLQVFAATGNNPGVCNIGGTKQGCYDADARVIGDFEAMRAALEGAKVPPRFVDADQKLRDVLAKNINGLDLRNQGIATSSDALWQQGQQLLKEVEGDWAAAYAAFPADNRPPLSP
jgi:hypothetical protein